MVTNRDLVEADAFHRRRLAAALVSGAPGGREVEPARPGRAVLGGLALAVLLAVGAAVAGVVTGDESAAPDARTAPYETRTAPLPSGGG